MKKLVRYLSLSLTVIIFTLLASCDKTHSKLADQVYVDNESIVFEFDVAQLVKKANVKKLVSAAEIENILNSTPESISVLLKGILNTEESPIDFTQKTYLIFAKLKQYPIVHFAVKDSKKLASQCIDIAETIDLEVNKTTVDQFNVYEIGETSVIFSDTRGFIINNEQFDENYIKLAINPGDNTLNNQYYSKSLGNKANDIQLVYSNEALHSFLNMSGINIDNSFLKDIYQTISISFEKGYISSLLTVLYKDENPIKDLYTYKKIDKSLEQYIIDNPILVAYINTIGENILNNPMTKELFSSAKLQSIRDQNIKTEITNLVKNINGDIAIYINNIDPNIFNPKVDLAIVVDGNSKNLLEAFTNITNLLGQDITTLDDNLFMIQDKYLPIYFAEKNGKFILTSLKETIDNFKKQDSNITKARYYKGNQDYGYFTIDLDKIVQMPQIQQLLMFTGEKNSQLINLLDYAKIEMQTKDSATMRLQFKSSKLNALELILSTLK